MVPGIAMEYLSGVSANGVYNCFVVAKHCMATGVDEPHSMADLITVNHTLDCKQTTHTGLIFIT